MKVFNEVNGKEVVNVQINDIAFLSNATDIAIPASIFTKVFSGVVIVDDSNRFDFVQFEEPLEINFFKSMEWIIDYNKYMAFSDEELEKQFNEEVQAIDKIVDTYNAMSKEEKSKNQHLILDYECRKYKVDFINQIGLVKEGKSEISIPEILKVSYAV